MNAPLISTEDDLPAQPKVLLVAASASGDDATYLRAALRSLAEPRFDVEVATAGALADRGDVVEARLLPPGVVADADLEVPAQLAIEADQEALAGAARLRRIEPAILDHRIPAADQLVGEPHRREVRGAVDPVAVGTIQPDLALLTELEYRYVDSNYDTRKYDNFSISFSIRLRSFPI